MNIKNYITSKVIAILFVTLIALMIFFCLFSYYYQKTRAENFLNDYSESLTRRVANSLVFPLWDFKKDTIEKNIINELADDSLFALIVKDFNNHLYVGKIKNKSGIILNYSNENKNFFEKTLQQASIIKIREIKKGEEIIGFAELYFSNNKMNQNLKNFIVTVIGVIFIISFIIMLVIFFSLKKFIITPIITLYNAINQFGKDDLDFEIEINSNDEIGKLSASFISMAKQFKGNFTEMLNQNKKIKDQLLNMESAQVKLNNKICLLEKEIEEKNRLLKMLPLDHKKRDFIQLTVEDQSISALKNDPITGLVIQSVIIDQFHYEIKRHKRNQKPISIILVGIDQFEKKVQEYGSDHMDLMLSKIGQTLTQKLRSQDIISRWAKDEFLLLLPETDLVGAKVVAEKVSRLIQAIDLNFNQQTIRLELNIGISAYDETSTVDHCIKQVKIRLLKAANDPNSRIISS